MIEMFSMFSHKVLVQCFKYIVIFAVPWVRIYRSSILVPQPNGYNQTIYHSCRYSFDLEVHCLRSRTPSLIQVWIGHQQLLIYLMQNTSNVSSVLRIVSLRLDCCFKCLFCSTTVVLVILQRPVSSGKKITPNQVCLVIIALLSVVFFVWLSMIINSFFLIFHFFSGTKLASML